MKLLLMFFIAFTTPITVFLATIIYGNISTSELKKSLADSNAYIQIHEHLSKQDKEAMDRNELISDFVSQRFTAEYIQSKTESVIDQSGDWITGKTAQAPVVSLKELKDDMMSKQPDLFNTIDYVPSDDELNQAGMSEEDKLIYLNQAKQVKEFTANDFTLPLDRHLQSIKDIYKGLQIGVPVLAILILSCFIMIAVLTVSIPSKLKWVGSTFLISAIVGYGILYAKEVIASWLTQINFIEKTETLALILPIFFNVLNHFYLIYVSYQEIVNNIFLLLAAACFIGLAFTRKLKPPAVKPLKYKDNYWTKPLKTSKTSPKT